MRPFVGLIHGCAWCATAAGFAGCRLPGDDRHMGHRDIDKRQLFQRQLDHKLVCSSGGDVMRDGHLKVDWSKATARARWWAINKDGLAHWYCAPDIACYSSFWFSEVVPAPAFDYCGDYKKSLTSRPERRTYF